MPASAMFCNSPCKALCGGVRRSLPVPAAKRRMGRQSPQQRAVSPVRACRANSRSPQASPWASA
eukprot:7585901-Prorocentrum_lima.AAC.1